MVANSFLGDCARELWGHYGEDIVNLHLVFPGHRARLFFSEALGRLIERPLWQPHFLSMDELIWQMSGMHRADNLRLVAELYTIYSRFHPETFERFYSRGVMLLQDFDTIDKYLLPARKLFVNVADLKDIEQFFADDSAELELVKNFWRNFSKGKTPSREQQEFLKVWHSLADIYELFNERLEELGVAYAGRAYRRAAESVLADDGATYCFIGFNALNNCEQKILKKLADRGRALFLWDFSSLYIEDNNQEAGRFLRRNLRRFPQAFSVDCDYNKNLEVEVISSPTDVLQCKALSVRLEEIFARQGFVDKESAVVLTDESLLPQVLTSIPECVERINVTMGYALTNTLVYNYIERLVGLQQRRRTGEFYFKDVIGLLNHPYVKEKSGVVSDGIINAITKKQQVYVPVQNLADFAPIFTPASYLGDYILSALSYISATVDCERREFTFTAMREVARLNETIKNCSIPITSTIYVSLLRKTLAATRIPYTGEPLGGLQILGILETRNLDFRNVILLSADDDNFPGNRSPNTYIPYNLRQGYGLPTTADAEAMYAYYFYRLLPRAQTLTMLYTSAASERSTGERSRYIYQLEYESAFDIRRREIAISIGKPQNQVIRIEKGSAIVEKLQQMRFAPSALNRYICCPLKFYFADVERIRVSDTVEQEFTPLALGNALHRVMELLYEPIVGRANPQRMIAAITAERVEEVIEGVIREQRVAQSAISQIGCDTLRRYVKSMLRYDAKREDTYIVERLEERIEGEICGLRLFGTADRLDRTENGTIIVVDYKSGQGDSADFKSVEELFDGRKGKKAIFQMLIYSLIIRHTEGVDVQPALYIGKSMGRKDFSGTLRVKIDDGFLEDFQRHLLVLVQEIFNENIPFEQCENRAICEYCDYRQICNF